MDLSKVLNFKIDSSRKKTLQEKALVLLGGFLSLMLLFTLLSRSANSLTLPEARTGSPRPMTIDHSLEINGKIDANRALVVSTVGNIRIATVYVDEGVSVKAGDVLFALDLADLDEQLLIAQVALEKLELQHLDLQATKTLEAENNKKAANRATEDFNLAVTTSEGNINKAYDEMLEAENDRMLRQVEIEANQALDLQNKEKNVNRAIEDYNQVVSTTDKNISRAYDEMIAEKNNLTLQKTALQSHQTRNDQNKKNAVNRAEQDYNILISETDNNVQSAYQEMNLSKNNLDNYTKGNDSDAVLLASLEHDYKMKKQGYQVALVNKENSLLIAGRAIEDAKAIVVSDNSQEINNLEKAYQDMSKAYEEALIDKENSLLLAQRGIDDASAIIVSNYSSELKALLTNYEVKKQVYENALTDKEGTIIQKQRAIEDANSSMLSDHSLEIAAFDIEMMRQEIEKLETLKVNNGLVTAPIDGTVMRLVVATGEKTSDDIAVLLSDSTSGYSFKAEIEESQAKYIKEGDPVTLTFNKEKNILENLKINTIYASLEDSKVYHISVNIPLDTKNLGRVASIKINNESKNYENGIALEALHKEDSKTYVFLVTEKETVLGCETIVERMDVIVEDKNDEYAAISGAFDRTQKFVLSSNKPIETGDRIRLIE